MNYSTSYVYFASVIAYLESQGISERLLHSHLSFWPEGEHDVRVPLESYETLLEVGARLTKDTLFGFHLGQSILAADYGVLGYLVESSRDLKHTIEALLRYDALVANIGRAEFTEQQQAKISWQPFSKSNSHVVLRNMTAWVAVTRQVLKSTLSPLEVRFAFDIPATNLPELAAWFGCAIQVNQSENAIVFDRHLLDIPFLSKNEMMHRTFLHLSDDALAMFAKTSGVKRQVTMLLEAKSDLFNVNQVRVAAALNLSCRHLQRRLKEENTCFSILLDEERKRRLAPLLGVMPLALIAEKLGFAEQSSFNKAFKKWYGTSPNEFLKAKLKRH
ncbi:AraC family transcriptional regulator [Pseudoalteromonas xiamenensis]